MAKDRIATEVGQVKRACAPSCKKNKPHEACACTDATKIVLKIEIFAVFGGVRRYRAWFTPLTDKEREEKIAKKEAPLPKVSNKDRFDERGEFSEARVFIPPNIYRAMARRALAIIKKSERMREKHNQKQAPPA